MLCWFLAETHRWLFRWCLRWGYSEKPQIRAPCSVPAVTFVPAFLQGCAVPESWRNRPGLLRFQLGSAELTLPCLFSICFMKGGFSTIRFKASLLDSLGTGEFGKVWSLTELPLIDQSLVQVSRFDIQNTQSSMSRMGSLVSQTHDIRYNTPTQSCVRHSH